MIDATKKFVKNKDKSAKIVKLGNDYYYQDFLIDENHFYFFNSLGIKENIILVIVPIIKCQDCEIGKIERIVLTDQDWQLLTINDFFELFGDVNLYMDGVEL